MGKLLSFLITQFRNDLKACDKIFFGAPSGAFGNEISVIQRPIGQLKTHISKHNISCCVVNVVSVVNPISHENPVEPQEG